MTQHIIIDLTKFSWKIGLKLAKMKYANFEEFNNEAWINPQLQDKIRNNWGDIQPFTKEEKEALTENQLKIFKKYEQLKSLPEM